MLWHHRTCVSSREHTPRAYHVTMVFAQSAGRAGVDHLSPSAFIRPSLDLRHIPALPTLRRTVPCVLLSYVQTLFFLFSGRGDNAGGNALLGLSFSILCSLSCTPTRYCFIFIFHPCWLDRTIMRSDIPFCKRPSCSTKSPNSTRFENYDSIISPALHVDLNLL